MDDKQIHWYNSDTGQVHPVPPWMEKAGPVYWDRQLRKAKYYQPEFRNNVRVGMRRFNQTEGESPSMHIHMSIKNVFPLFQISTEYKINLSCASHCALFFVRILLL